MQNMSVMFLLLFKNVMQVNEFSKSKTAHQISDLNMFILYSCYLKIFILYIRKK